MEMRNFEEQPLTLYVRVKEELRAAIMNGDLKPFDQLPSESALTGRFKVSRITVRQALSDLQKEGIIFKVHGKGSFVSKPKTDQTLARLKGFAEAMGEAGHETYNQLLEFNEVSADAQVAARLSLPAGMPVIEIKRLRFLDRSPISVDISYLPVDVGHRLAKADLATRDIFLIMENDLGIALGNADLSIEAAGADEHVAKLLKIGRHAPLLRIERLTYAKDGRPLDFEYLFYRGDAFRYRLSVQR
jgi:GntR family transcriptional regulator